MGDDASFGPRRVQNRRGMPLGQHEAVVVLAPRILGIEPHLGEEQRGHHLRG